MSTSMEAPQPSPELIFGTINAYQGTAALKAAIELDLFSAIGEGKNTPVAIAARCGASERGVRILSDFLVIHGFLKKEGGRYALTPDTAAFLDRTSPAYIGACVEFMLSPELTSAFSDLTAVVKRGGTIRGQGTVEPENPIWVKFAKSMAPLTAMPSRMLAQMVKLDRDKPAKLLDIAAGHGNFGIAFAREYPALEVVALDWPQVLEVAKENAGAAGVGNRFRTIAGDAFGTEFGDGYDVVLITNFLHHFDKPTCVGFLKKVRVSLRSGGRAVTVEFVPNEDRISPPAAAAFSLMMLGSTPSGDAYTFAELRSMFDEAGFGRSEIHSLPPRLQSAVITEA